MLETSVHPSEAFQGEDAWLWQIGGIPVQKRLGLEVKVRLLEVEWESSVDEGWVLHPQFPEMGVSNT